MLLCFSETEASRDRRVSSEFALFRVLRRNLRDQKLHLPLSSSGPRRNAEAREDRRFVVPVGPLWFFIVRGLSILQSCIAPFNRPEARRRRRIVAIESTAKSHLTGDFLRIVLDGR